MNNTGIRSCSGFTASFAARVSGPQLNQMLKVAAERVASLLLREALDLDASEIKDRFGFAAGTAVSPVLFGVPPKTFGPVCGHWRKSHQ